ncbi:MAG TPA: hypothetical protein VFM82_06070 [Flavobacteriaceae bacterium]|nr:hypothetical protein [Flavobacteriaceae bacterium]
MQKEEIIGHVAEILKETPSAEDIVKKGGDRNKRFRYLARYMVEKGIKKNGLILSKNEKGIAILFRTNRKDSSFLNDIGEEIGLLFNVTGIKNAYRILKNQGYIKAQRPKEGDYLYCWFWGIIPGHRGADTQVGKEMKDEFLRRANESNLPLYAETRTKRNVIVYQKFGFQLFHTWERPDGETMWFLRYIPPASERPT